MKQYRIANAAAAIPERNTNPARNPAWWAMLPAIAWLRDAPIPTAVEIGAQEVDQSSSRCLRNNTRDAAE